MATITNSAKKSKRNPDTILLGPGGAWHRSAPRRVCETYRTLPDDRGWAVWCKHLAKRKFCPIAELLPGKRSALTWALPAADDLDDTLVLIDQLARLSAGKPCKDVVIENEAACWLGNVETATASATLGLECLAWCAALPQLTDQLPEQLWWMVLNRLVAVAGDAGAAGEDPLTAQLLLGELPLALAYSFPELATCEALAASGRRTLSQTIADLLDGEGLPQCRTLHLFRPLLACWTRCRALGQELNDGWCDEEAEKQYPGMVEHALRLTRTDGRQMFAAADGDKWDPNLLKAALRFADDRQVERIYKLVNPAGRGASNARGKNLPSPAFEGEWAGLAVLRSDWSRGAPRLSVAHGTEECLMELSLGDTCLWSGLWDIEVRFNQQTLKPQGEWEQTCWISDGEVDYLELEAQLGDQVSVQRHILLARKERFLFLGDAVMGIQQGSLEYRGTLPIAGMSEFQGERETREGTLLVGERARARVLPLALGEWRSGPSRGTLQATDCGLELTQKAEGEGLFAPLFIDLDSSRFGKAVTWRQLTVGQMRQVLPADVAVGYRVQIGKSQRLIYRSLSVPDVRTVLGKNLMHEFLIGTFESDGEITTLLEIE